MTSLVAELRTSRGTGSSKLLYKQAKIPAIMYGKNHPQLSIALEEKEITKLYHKGYFLTTPIEIIIDNQKYQVLPQALDLHPITDKVRHVDFKYLDLHKQKVEVPIKFEGREKAVGIKRGGFFNIIKRKIPLICQPENIVRYIEFDISQLNIGEVIKVSDLVLPPECSLTIPSDTVIASMIGKGGKEEENPATDAKK